MMLLSEGGVYKGNGLSRDGFHLRKAQHMPRLAGVVRLRLRIAVRRPHKKRKRPRVRGRVETFFVR